MPMSYSIVHSIILQKEAAESAAEVHGVAVAMLCLDTQVEVGEFLSEAIAKDADLLEEDKYTLIHLFEQTQELLASEEFIFDLFLPDEEATLVERSEALMQWCQGFLFGMGRIQTRSEWPGNVGEILQDMVEFTKLEVSAADDAEEAENALAEIQEYLRASVMLIRSELNQLNNNNDDDEE